jgi:hypothetical protein
MGSSQTGALGRITTVGAKCPGLPGVPGPSMPD